jgi:hypothetical protein
MQRRFPSVVWLIVIHVRRQNERAANTLAPLFWLTDERYVMSRGRCFTLFSSFRAAQLKGGCSKPTRENVYLWLPRSRKRCTVVLEVNDVRQTSAHEIAADIGFHNRLDTRPCIGRDRIDTRYGVCPSAPKDHDEAWFVLSKRLNAL